jgi:hypothetical protein
MTSRGGIDEALGILSGGSHICNSPLNLSKSKARFSFAKDKRFRQNQEMGYCPKNAYENPSTLSKRCAGIGYGKRTSMGKSEGTKIY